jgi:3-phosphoshikimate 1-carboxyvinyltransferase
MKIEIKRNRSLRGELTVPPDKSISHRTLMLSALAYGESTIHNLSPAQDVASTLRCVLGFGLEIQRDGSLIRLKGKGPEGFREPGNVLDCGNSGTTMRLLSGVAAARPFLTILTGDDSLRQRPMSRIVEPLRFMGAHITGRDESRRAPLVIQGGGLRGIEYHLPVASAQVKSALLLAGLGAEGKTTVVEKYPSRDHTERMLSAMGAAITVSPGTIEIDGSRRLEPCGWRVPGDISSAAFFIIAAAAVPGSEILLRDVGINPTRAGILDVLVKMGVDIRRENLRSIGGEPIADIVVRSSIFQPVTLEQEIIPNLIDEIPVLAVAMALAQGTSTVRNAGELRGKESDRIKMIVGNLSKLGVRIEELEDGFIVQGNGSIPGGVRVPSSGDHRIAMSMAVAGLRAEQTVTVEDFDCVAISYPGFINDLDGLTQ